MDSNYDVQSAVAGEIMTPYVIQLNINAVFRDVIKVLRENNISAVFIYDSTNDRHFIISQTDVVRFLHEGGLDNKKIAEVPVSKIMQGPVEMLDIETSVDQIIRFMTSHNYKRVLISKKGKATGVISTRDILKWNNTYFKPAKPQILLFQDNETSGIIARHFFEECIEEDVKKDLIDIFGGALKTISIITEEVIHKSGNLYQLMKTKRSVLFEPYRNITGILICDYNSIELRRNLQKATRIFYEQNAQLFQSAENLKRGIFKMVKIDEIAGIFKIKEDLIC